MRASDGVLKFGEWLPDLADLDNPGLIEASGVLPLADGYSPYLPLLADTNNIGTTYPGALPLGAIQSATTTGVYRAYAGTDTALLVFSGVWVDRSPAPYAAAAGLYWRFVQFDDLMVALNNQHVPQRHQITSVSNFTNLASTGTAPTAREGGVIGRFLVLGDTLSGGRCHLQWPAIDDPTNWPTPGTAAAVAVQAGQQFMKSSLGAIRRIVGGDQFGIVLQAGGLTRVTYVGSPLVFQFDEFDVGQGCFWPNSVVQVGGLTYYAGLSAFYVTDGVRVERIGEFKVDRRFVSAADITFQARLYAGVDRAQKLIYWCIPTSTSTSGRPNRVFIYNYGIKRWSEANQDMEVITNGTPVSGGDLMLAFTSANVPGFFTGVPTTAVLTTGEKELNPGGRTLLQGIKPLVTGASPSLTVAVGARDSQGAAASFTAEVTPTARTGFADFRSDARFHRARTTITGAFTKATGLELQQARGGAA